jgi:hypothetical protein
VVTAVTAKLPSGFRASNEKKPLWKGLVGGAGVRQDLVLRYLRQPPHEVLLGVLNNGWIRHHCGQACPRVCLVRRGDAPQ